MSLTIAPGTAFALAFALILAFSLAPRAQDPSHAVKLAWDRNSDATAGYRVLVGTQSGVYDDAYDVGAATTFRYTRGIPGRRYYFVVVAYDAGGRESSYSNEISMVFGRAVPASKSGGRHDASVKSEHPPTEDSQDSPATIGTVSGLAVLPTGDALFVEDSNRVRVVRGSALVVSPALTAPGMDAQFTEVVIDPHFERTGYVFVGVTASMRDGSHELRIIRYRLVADTLGEGATIIAGLSYDGSTPPPFTVDNGGRIYVAMPDSNESRSIPYAGRILRFEADGSVSPESRSSSPVIAAGLRSPRDLDWQTDRAWLVGVDERLPSGLAVLQSTTPEFWSLPLPQTNARLPQLPVTAFDVVTAIEEGHVIGRGAVIDAAHRLYRIVFRGNDVVALKPLPWTGEAEPIDVALGARGNGYVVTRDQSGAFGIVPMEAF